MAGQAVAGAGSRRQQGGGCGSVFDDDPSATTSDGGALAVDLQGELRLGVLIVEPRAGEAGQLALTRSEIDVGQLIESIADGGQVFASDSTFLATKDIVRTAGHLNVKLKGLEKPVTIHEIDGIDAHALATALDIPAEKLGKLLRLEDAILAAVEQARTGD